MLQSKLFATTKKEASKEAESISHKLLVRADFIDQLASGVYSFLPLGSKVLKNIEKIIREQMLKIGGQEVFLPTLQPKEIWKKTSRWQNMKPPLFKLKDRHKREFALGPTHEEVITKLAKGRMQSYKDLPLYLFQIQNKFRNELRFTGGLLRTREFLMKDLYSFHKDEKDLENYFEKVLTSYEKIFKRCGLKTIQSKASGEAFTERGAKTYEFQVPAEGGEDKFFFCEKCRFAVSSESASQKFCPRCKKKLEKINAIETGHCFQLGKKYSKGFDLYFIDETGKRKLVTMGCYGIGLGRLMGTIVEIHHDKKGIIWPIEVAPFKVHLIFVPGKKVKKEVQRIYKILKEKEIEVLFDDRIDISPGEKFAEADLIGIPIRLLISEKTLKINSVEVKERKKKKAKLIKIKRLSQFLISNFHCKL